MQSPTGQGYDNGGLPKEEDHPWYVKYGIRALGTFAGGLCLLFGALNVIFSVFSPTCMLFSIWQMLVGFVVVTIEAPFCCAFVDHVQVVARKIEDKPLFVKAGVYILAPLPTILFCFGFYSLLGGGVVIGAGVIYAMIALGKKATREEMARNAQTVLPPGDNYPSQNQPTSDVKNPFSTVNIMRDPVQAAAAQWASQSTPSSRPQFEPPPSYNASVSSTQQPPRNAWDQSFVNENPANKKSYGDPNNPFQ